MRSARITLACAGLVLAACGGGAAATPGPGSATTAPGGASSAPTTAPQMATPAPAVATDGPPAGGASTATVILTGGPHAGTYTATGNPLCSYGLVGEGIWGAQFTTDSDELSSVQVVIPGPGVEGAHLSVSATIGPLLSGTTYTIFDSGTGEATDNGATAVLHATGTTDQGANMEVTVNCPALMRS